MTEAGRIAAREVTGVDTSLGDVRELVPVLRFLCDPGAGRAGGERWAEARPPEYPACHEGPG